MLTNRQLSATAVNSSTSRRHSLQRITPSSAGSKLSQWRVRRHMSVGDRSGSTSHSRFRREPPRARTPSPTRRWLNRRSAPSPKKRRKPTSVDMPREVGRPRQIRASSCAGKDVNRWGCGGDHVRRGTPPSTGIAGRQLSGQLLPSVVESESRCFGGGAVAAEERRSLFFSQDWPLASSQPSDSAGASE